jgi:two-component system response regulator HydG
MNRKYPKKRRLTESDFDSGRGTYIAAVAGAGWVAKHAVQAGADVLLALGAGVARNHGHGSLAAYLPFTNANEEMQRLVRSHLIPVCGATPIVAGILPGDPYHSVESCFEKYAEWGVRGITNWPASGLELGPDAVGITPRVKQELEMLVAAKRRGFQAWAFVFTPDQVRAAAELEIDALLLHLGLTRTLEDALVKQDLLQMSVTRLQNLLDAVPGNRDPLRFLFGGIVTEPEDLNRILQHCSMDGMAGGSVFERLPLIDTLTGTIRRFKGTLARHREGNRAAEDMQEILGSSPPMLELFHSLRKIAPHDVSVLIEGESGTGKELVAVQLHKLNPVRAHHPFVTLNCGALPDALLESELFGHEKGAFTGAQRLRLGKFELAQHGTLFLDEIADLSAHGQVALLRAIQQREIVRVGGDRPLQVDVRVLAASNRRLEALVAEGRFRADLYHRLNTVTLRVPPLRERLGDLPILIEHFLQELREQLGHPLRGVSSRLSAALMRHSWPGNVRELRHVLWQSALLESAEILEGHSFRPREYTEPQQGSLENLLTTGATFAKPGRAGAREQRLLQRREAAERALNEAGGNKAEAARRLGITRRTFYGWLGVDL